MTEAVRTIAIVGAGFCGTLVAVHLLKAQPLQRLRVVLIDSGEAGRGLAYSTDDSKLLLNVPAGGMSAFDDAQEDFVNYLAHRYGKAAATDFVPRQIYGDYLQKTLNEAVANKSEAVEFDSVRARVDDIAESSNRYDVQLSNGKTVSADKIVLTLGNAKPSAPALADSDFFKSSARYIDDPWCEDLPQRIDNDRPLVLIGTGLTAVDIVLKLSANQFKPKIYAISRHGLQPISHRGLSGKLPTLDIPALRNGDRLSLLHITRTLRAHSELANAEGRDWRDVIAALRPNLPQVWQQLESRERRRLLRHAAAYWDVHRHRLAPAVAASLHDVMLTKRLTLMAGRLSSLTDCGDHVSLRVTPRGSNSCITLEAGTVINCTGPNTKIDRLDDPLIRSLRKRNLLKADALNLGIEVARNYATIEHGPHAKSIFYVGPWLKAEFWEATAVPELRGHAKRVADQLLASVNP